MADKTATLVLDGEVTLSAFADAVSHFDRLIRKLSLKHGGGEMRWVVEELDAGSAVATVRAEAEPERVTPVLDAYLETGEAVAKGQALLLEPEIRREVLGIVAVVDGDIPSVRFETSASEVLITRQEERPADFPVGLEPGQVTKAYGGVQGRVQTLSSRGSLRFTMYDTLFDRAVSCYLHEGQEELMRDVWGRVAVVEGWVARDPVSGRAQTVRQVHRITPISEVAADAYLAARGAVHPRPDAPPPEARIRALRDADDLLGR